MRSVERSKEERRGGTKRREKKKWKVIRRIEGEEKRNSDNKQNKSE